MRRAVIFTLMSVVIALVLVLVFFVNNGRAPITTPSETIRVEVMNAVVRGFEGYATVALRQSTYASLVRFSEIYGEESDQDLQLFFRFSRESFRANLSRCVLVENATVRPANFDHYCLNSTALPGLLRPYAAIISDELGVKVQYSFAPDSLQFDERDATTIVVSVRMNLTVSDPFANWTIVDHVLNTTVSLAGIKNPLIEKARIKTVVGRYKATGPAFPLMLHNFTGPWNTEKTGDLYAGRLYRTSPGAPSFIARFYGDLSNSSCCGVETFVNSSDYVFSVSPSLPPNSNYSVLDHQLFNTSAYGYLPPAFSYCEPFIELYAVKDVQGLVLDTMTAGRYGLVADDLEQIEDPPCSPWEG